MAELEPALTAAGFQPVELRDRFDCFRGSTKEKTARKYRVTGVNVYARKAG